MYAVNISVTVSRADINNQFKGLITFKNENKKLSFDYLCTGPDEKQIDIEFSNRERKFGVKGIPSKKLFKTLSGNQKLIFALSVEPLFSIISNTQNLSLSHKTTELLKMCCGEVSVEMDFNIEVGEKEYLSLFGN